MFQNLPKLQILNLNKMELTEMPNLATNANLLELHLNNNSLMTIDVQKLLGSPPNYSQVLALTILEAANNRIKSIDNEILRSMNGLETLNLGSNELTSFPLKSLSQSSNLEHIDLKSNQIETLMDWNITGTNNLKIDITGMYPPPLTIPVINKIMTLLKNKTDLDLTDVKIAGA